MNTIQVFIDKTHTAVDINMPVGKPCDEHALLLQAMLRAMGIGGDFMETPPAIPEQTPHQEKTRGVTGA